MNKTAAISQVYSEEPDDQQLEVAGLQQEVEAIAYPQEITKRKVESVEYLEITSCASHTPIYEAARIMSRQKVNCLFVTGEQEQIIGYVTDTTLREQVVAQKTDVHQPVGQVMDTSIVSVDKQTYVYEAILLMFQAKTGYLLIEEDGKYLGVISRTKLLSEQAQSPFVFIQSVKLALSVEELKRKWEQVPDMVSQLLHQGVKVEIVNL